MYLKIERAETIWHSRCFSNLNILIEYTLKEISCHGSRGYFKISIDQMGL
jgi:hypothetical protein